MGDRANLAAIGRAVAALALAFALVWAYVYSPLPIFWEYPEQDQPYVYSMTWHSLLLVLVSAWLLYVGLTAISRWRSKQNAAASRDLPPNHAG